MQDTKIIESSTTDIKGKYVFTSVKPGNYILKASHESFEITKNTINFETKWGSVNVEEIFEITGFSVKGRITKLDSTSEGLKDVSFQIKSRNGKGRCGKINKECEVISNENGYFEFKSIEPGTYTIVYLLYIIQKPITQSKVFEFEPSEIETVVNTDNVILKSNFKVISVLVKGKVVGGDGNKIKGISDVSIIINNNHEIFTNEFGSFEIILKHRNVDIIAKKDGYEFNKIEKFTPNYKSPYNKKVEIPTIKVTKMRVNGKIEFSGGITNDLKKDKLFPRTINVLNLKTNKNKKIESDNIGKFSDFIDIGTKYEISVEISKKETSLGLTLSPNKHTIELTGSESIPEILFNSVFASLTINLSKLTESSSVTFIIKSVDEFNYIKEIEMKNSSMKIDNILPGNYEISIKNEGNNYCYGELKELLSDYKKNQLNEKKSIKLVGEKNNEIAFFQSGYKLYLTSEHEENIVITNQVYIYLYIYI